MQANINLKITWPHIVTKPSTKSRCVILFFGTHSKILFSLYKEFMYIFGI